MRKSMSADRLGFFPPMGGAASLPTPLSPTNESTGYPHMSPTSSDFAHGAFRMDQEASMGHLGPAGKPLTFPSSLD